MRRGGSRSGPPYRPSINGSLSGHPTICRPGAPPGSPGSRGEALLTTDVDRDDVQLRSQQGQVSEQTLFNTAAIVEF